MNSGTFIWVLWLIEKLIFMKENNIYLKIILSLTMIGIWALVLQNAGIIPTKEQTVEVSGGQIDAYIDGEVEISGGSIEVENTVSVSIDEVLGSDNKKYYFKN
jgi:hypothetical protein